MRRYLKLNDLEPSTRPEMELAANLRALIYCLGFMAGYLISKETVKRNYKALRLLCKQSQSDFEPTTYEKVWSEIIELGKGIYTIKS